RAVCGHPRRGGDRGPALPRVVYGTAGATAGAVAPARGAPWSGERDVAGGRVGLSVPRDAPGALRARCRRWPVALACPADNGPFVSGPRASCILTPARSRRLTSVFAVSHVAAIRRRTMQGG